jgi:general stress protein CsbA
MDDSTFWLKITKYVGIIITIILFGLMYEKSYSSIHIASIEVDALKVKLAIAQQDVNLQALKTQEKQAEADIVKSNADIEKTKLIMSKSYFDALNRQSYIESINRIREESGE